MVPPAVAGAHGNVPVLFQVTNNTIGNVEEPAIRSQAGDSIVFVSDGDVLGPGTAPGHREVYLYNGTSGAITRLTNTTDGESYDASRETDSLLTAARGVVTFVSTGDLDPSIGNADHNPEVFLHFVESGQNVQVTNTVAPVVNAEPYTSDSGRCVVFRSNADLDDNDGSDTGNPGSGHSNADGSDEIFNLSFGDIVSTRSDWVTTQVSNGPAGTSSSHPVVGGYIFTRQCRSTAYQSTHDQLGNGSSGSHIYNYTRTTAGTEQFSAPGAGMNLNPAMSSASNFARGPFVVYESDMDPIGNGSSVFEIYRFRLFKDELWQYTFADADSASPGVSDGGGRTVFQSTADLLDPNRTLRNGEVPPFNSDGNSEIFLTKRKHQITQVTSTVGCDNTLATMRDTGDSIAFRSTCDLIPGHNPGGVAQVFQYVLVKGSDALATAGACVEADGCCNVANGCLTHLIGRKVKPPRSGIRPDYTN
ncbi:MAG: hypothetical protein ABR587_00605 [Candidatus Binatia bacterium]